jgi:hypothetical protein
VDLEKKIEATEELAVAVSSNQCMNVDIDYVVTTVTADR